MHVPAPTMSLLVLAVVVPLACAALALGLVIRHARRRRRLSKLLSAEGWHTATGVDDDGWRWSGVLGGGAPSAIFVDTPSRTVDLRVHGALPEVEGGWVLVSRRLVDADSRFRERWRDGLPRPLVELLERQAPGPCSGIVGFWLLSQGGARPSPELLHELARMPQEDLSWVVWACGTDRWVRRIGPRPHLAWPQVRRLGKVLAGG